MAKNTAPIAMPGFNYLDVNFTRKFKGNVVCHAVHDYGGEGLGVHPVCQFAAPEVVQVVTPTSVAVFGPRIFRDVTVEVVGGTPTCRLAANDDLWMSKD